MYCENCGTELAENSSFCTNCGNKVKCHKNKNMYIALILTFILTGLGSIYAGNIKKGVILLIVRVLSSALTSFSNIFLIITILVWVFGFYETYRDVQIANGQTNPRFINDFKSWNQNNQIIAVLIIAIILILAIIGCVGALIADNYQSSNSDTHYYVSSSGSGSSSGSSHYSGVDNSPSTIAKNDPDWYYDHYEYGDNDQIDEYLESQGYD